MVYFLISALLQCTCTVSCYMYVDIYTFDPYPAIKSVEWTPSYYKYHNQKTTLHSCWTNNINGFFTSGVVLPNWFLDNPYLFKLCQILFSIKDTTYFRFDRAWSLSDYFLLMYWFFSSTEAQFYQPFFLFQIIWSSSSFHGSRVRYKFFCKRPLKKQLNIRKYTR